MLKERQGINKSYSFPKLHRDDLEEIEQIVKSELGSEGFRISCPEFDCDSVSDINANKYPSADSLNISKGGSGVYIHIDKESAWVKSDKNTGKERSVVDQVGDILKNKKRYWSKIPFILILIFFILEGRVNQIGVKLNLPFAQIYSIQVAIMIIPFSLFFLFVKSRYYPKPVIFTSRKDSPGFWKRYRDQIWLLVLGGAVTLAIQYINHLFKWIN